MTRKLLLIFLSVFFTTSVFASSVDTIVVYSKSMDKNIKTVIVLPDVYKNLDSFSVIYLLHGYSDNYATWIKKVPHLKELADQFRFIIVMPDGDYNSWYWDSPVDPKSRYESFISKELVEYIDKNFKTVPDRNSRAITGISMGGQGALFLAFRHQDVFASAGSMSGGVDIRPFPNEWDMADKLGSFAENTDQWNDYAVINQVFRLVPDSLNIIIDCGTSDFFYDVNKKLHKKLLYRNIPHVYIEKPGRHNWKYWNDAIDYQMLFFSKHLKTEK